MKKLRIPLLIFFVLIVGIELIGCLTADLTYEYIAKPWIMPWIAVYFLLYFQKQSIKWKVLLAFFFCWTGDVLLLLANVYELFFYTGVGGFLIGHLFYISIFSGHGEYRVKGFVSQKPLVILPYLLYLAGIIALLFPVMTGIMRPIIIVYGVVLIGMALAAVNRKGRVSSPVFNRIFWGSILFVLSDTLIAVNKFHTEFDYARVLIMSTYIAAQVLILSGLVIEKDYQSK